MKLPGLRIVVATATVLIATALQADVRVLFRFDETGHQVHRVFQLQPEPISSVLQQRERGSAPGKQSNPSETHNSETHNAGDTLHGEARVSWFNAAGAWLTTSLVADPRISHAPAHIDGGSASQVVQSQGAWLATGPAAAARVTIELPENLSIGLGHEIWQDFLPDAGE
jgi:hypothetical protein